MKGRCLGSFRQLELRLGKSRGGSRRGAGRKRAAGARTSVSHTKRPNHKGRHPLHVTLRARRGLPSFRQQRVHRIFADVLRAQRRRRYKDDFRVIHFSVQRDHLHLVVEADTERAKAAGYNAIRSGVSGLAIAFARRLNQLLGRKGSVWADRYHRRDLKTPKEVFNGYRYVFGNYTHHGWWSFGDGVLDMHASGWVFDGWAWQHDKPADEELWRWPVCRAQTWLARQGYLKHGRLTSRPVHP